MRILAIILIIFANSFESLSQTTWIIDPAHSTVQFEVPHLTVSSVTGLFTTYTGTLTSEKNNDFENAQIQALIDVGSITTNNLERDKHLKEEDFFNAKEYPEIKFRSTSFEKTTGNNYLIKGDLTIRGITKPIILEAVYGGIIAINNKEKAGFEAEGTINRFDYGLKWDDALDNGGLIVGEKVDIILKMELVRE